MIYYVYFDPYGNPGKVVSERELAEAYGNDPEQFLRSACPEGTGAPRAGTAGHVGTLAFHDEAELKDYLASLGEELEGFFSCRSDSRPYNF